jgi:hypothetical protein
MYGETMRLVLTKSEHKESLDQIGTKKSKQQTENEGKRICSHLSASMLEEPNLSEKQ